MDILKDRAVWIVIVVILIAGAAYMIIVDPDRVDKMANIVDRDDERIADVNETNELIDRLDLKLRGTKEHLANLWILTENHIKDYEAKVDSVNHAFEKVDLSINKILRDMKDGFTEIRDDLEELEDGISSIKTQTKRDKRALDAEIQKLKESIEEINIRLEEEGI